MQLQNVVRVYARLIVHEAIEHDQFVWWWYTAQQHWSSLWNVYCVIKQAAIHVKKIFTDFIFDR